MARTATRSGALAGRHATGTDVAITPKEGAWKLSLRAPASSRAALAKILGVTLPDKPRTSASKGSRSALWLGPDEWLIVDDGRNNPTEALATSGALCSAVDISHRNVSIEVSGRRAAPVLSAGCPLDLDPEAFPVGSCTRTMFGKAEIVLWRTEPSVFRVDCWRSFSDYVFALLAESARDSVD